MGTPVAAGDYGAVTVVADNGKAPLDALSLRLTVAPAPLGRTD